MILSDHQVLQKLKTGELKISPLPSHEQIQPNGIDLRLGDEFWIMVSTEEALDTRNNEPKYEVINSNAILIPVNGFILATTKERVEIPADLCGRVEGRSSIGRIGLAVHITAGFVDSGFNGQITLEIKNLSPNPIVLYEGMRICQIVFEEVTGDVIRPYGTAGNKYQNQEGVTGSLLYWDMDNKSNHSPVRFSSKLENCNLNE